MQESELIKALECCYELDGWCSPENQNKCPLYGYEEEHCDKHLLKATLDLIKRQKTAIDILIRKKETLQDEIAEQQAEVEELQKYKHDYYVLQSITRKEFAERLKERKYLSGDWSRGEHPYVVEEEDIDDLLEEMESERE